MIHGRRLSRPNYEAGQGTAWWDCTSAESHTKLIFWYLDQLKVSPSFCHLFD